MAPMSRVPEPMMRHGYLGTYPRNPFLQRRRISFWIWEWDWGPQPETPCGAHAGDPRFGCVPGWQGGYIESSGMTMGNVLSDPRFDGADTAEEWGTLGPTGQPYYYLGDGDPMTVDWMPGQFIYRTDSDPEEEAGMASWYLLAAYGSVRNPGKDWLHCWDATDTGNGFGTAPGAVECGPEGFSPQVLWEAEGAEVGAHPEGASFRGFRNVALSFEGEAWPWEDIVPTNADGFHDGLLLFYTSIPDHTSWQDIVAWRNLRLESE